MVHLGESFLHGYFVKNSSPEMDLQNKQPLRLPSDASEQGTVEPANLYGRSQLAGLHRLFRPVLVFMGVFGLYHPSQKMVSDKTQPKRRSPTERWIFMTVGLLIFCYLLANFFLLITARPKLDMAQLETNIYIIILVWLVFAGSLNCLHFFVWEHGRVDTVWEVWASWVQKYPEIETNWGKMLKCRRVCLLTACVVAVTPPVTICSGMASAEPGTLVEGLLIPVQYGSPRFNHVLLTIDFTIISLIIYGTAAFTTVFFVTNCLLVSEELKQFYFTTAKLLEDGHIWSHVKEAGEEVSLLEQLRRRRLEVRTLVEKLNQAFDKVAFLSLFANVPLIVFTSYALITHHREGAFPLAMGIAAILVSMLHVGVITVASAWICEWANAPKDLLHTIKIHNDLEMSRANMASLSLFLSELTSDKIGITAWQLAVISKEFIATVFGLTVTYIIVLVEFGHQTEIVSVTHNITEQITNITEASTSQSF